MRALDEGEAATWREQSRLLLPTLVLAHLSTAGASTVSSLTEALIHATDALAVNEAASATQECIEWLIGRGDVYRTHSGRIRCFPPHLISDAVRSSFSKLPLFGSASAEPVLDRIAAQYGGYLCRETLPSPAGWGRGLDRYIAVPGDNTEPLLKDCDDQQIACFNLQDLSTGLPAVSELTYPPQDAFVVHPALGAVQGYFPTATRDHQAARWRQLDHVPHAELIRLNATSARGRQYFLRKGELLAEVSPDMAILWQYWLDQRANAPVPVFHDFETGMIWFGSRIPLDHYKWIQLLASEPLHSARFRNFGVRLRTGADQVKSVFIATLGVQWRDGSPPLAWIQ